MARFFRVGGHFDRFQRGVDARANFHGRHAEVFRPEPNVLFHNGGHKLVIRVLKHHAHAAANLQRILFVAGVHAAHGHFSFGGEEQRVKEFTKRALAGTVVPDNRNDLAFLNGKADVFQRGLLRTDILEPDVHEFYDGFLRHDLLPTSLARDAFLFPSRAIW